MAQPLTMYTTTWCAFCKRLKSQLARDGIEMTEVNIEEDPGAADGQVPVAKPVESLAGEAGKLRATVSQLEHALLARVRVEQAIGVLAERHRIKPRQAFEQLRTAARNRGRKVIDIASDVVASASNPLLQLPEELSRPRAGSRRVTHQPNSA